MSNLSEFALFYSFISLILLQFNELLVELLLC